MFVRGGFIDTTLLARALPNEYFVPLLTEGPTTSLKLCTGCALYHHDVQLARKKSTQEDQGRQYQCQGGQCTLRLQALKYQGTYRVTRHTAKNPPISLDSVCMPVISSGDKKGPEAHLAFATRTCHAVKMNMILLLRKNSYQLMLMMKSRNH